MSIAIRNEVLEKSHSARNKLFEWEAIVYDAQVCSSVVELVEDKLSVWEVQYVRNAVRIKTI